MWRDQIDEVLRNDPSDLERTVLSDYTITDAEYRQAQDAYRICMSEHGVDVQIDPAGSYTLHDADGGAVVDVNVEDAKCQVGTTATIEPVYLGMRDNPRGLTFAETLKECYQRKGVPDGEGLSAAQFEALVTAEDYHASTPDGLVCYWDPTGSVGVTQQEAAELDRNRVTQTADADPSSDGE